MPFPFPESLKELVFLHRNNPEFQNTSQHALISSHQSQHKGHQCKPLWPKSPPGKGRVDMRAGAEIWGSEQSSIKAPLGGGTKKEASSLLPRPHGLPGLWRRLAGVKALDGDSSVLPWILRGSSRRWTWRRVRSITESSGAHPGRWGAAKGAWRT